MKKLMLSVGLVMALLLPLKGVAFNLDVGASYDPGVLKALIEEHKTERSKMKMRSIMETGNAALHATSENTTTGYKEAADAMDTYTKVFDAMELIADATHLGFIAYKEAPRVWNNCAQSISMITKFTKEYAKHLEPRDVELLQVCVRGFTSIADDGKNLVNLCIQLPLYLSGKVRCTPAEVTEMIADFERTIKNASAHAAMLYDMVWRYIMMRTHFSRGEAYQIRSKSDIIKAVTKEWNQRQQEKGRSMTLEDSNSAK